MSENSMKPSNDNLEWVQLKKEIDQMHSEPFFDKIIRKTNDNPLVPVGCLATSLVLCVGIGSMVSGNPKLSQYMMRARVAAQSATIVAIVAGVMYGFTKS